MRHPLFLFLCFFLGASAASASTWYVMHLQKNTLKEALTTLEVELQKEKEEAIQKDLAYATEKQDLENTIAELTNTTDGLSKDRAELQDSLEEEQAKVGAIEKKVGKALKTVSVLDKLSKTDEELLQKYSKVYFLNEHYIPSKLSSIKKAYVYDESRDHKLHSQVMPFFEDMVEDALKSGIKLYASSAYRSFDEQASLKSAYTVTYGSGANTFSADQGYSEHQLGTAIDFVTTGIQGNIDGFENTPAFTWMVENAYKYGFVMSYPKGNAYYIYEPWHWRFVGENLAKKLHRDGKYFYDLDQREINEYLVSIFD